MIPARVVLATGNAGKVRELRALVAEWGGVQMSALADYPGVEVPAEDGATYEANAVLKARAVAMAVQMPALADDSGLEVDALGGAPGVFSARYAATDAERIAKLLAALTGVAELERTARFRCVVALAWPDGVVVTAVGECEGRVLSVPTGAGGFGYDPVFWSQDLARPLAEVPIADKQRVSHRARAVRALGQRLASS